MLESLFCREVNITTYAQQLVVCRTTFGELDPVQEIDDDLVVINDHSVAVASDNVTISLKKGTYLVTLVEKASVNEMNLSFEMPFRLRWQKCLEPHG